MGYIEVILMGIVQGLSEFLPISSSAHLVFTSNICWLFYEGVVINYCFHPWDFINEILIYIIKFSGNL